MSQTLTLPGEVYRKLAKGAAERGMTVESLLSVFRISSRYPTNRPNQISREANASRNCLTDFVLDSWPLATEHLWINLFTPIIKKPMRGPIS
jgi:hypothetical protein